MKKYVQFNKTKYYIKLLLSLSYTLIALICFILNIFYSTAFYWPIITFVLLCAAFFDFYKYAKYWRVKNLNILEYDDTIVSFLDNNSTIKIIMWKDINAATYSWTISNNFTSKAIIYLKYYDADKEKGLMGISSISGIKSTGSALDTEKFSFAIIDVLFAQNRDYIENIISSRLNTPT